MDSTATVQADLSFEDFRSLMKKWVDRIVPRRVRQSPFESRDDLYAEADVALFDVYRNPKNVGKPVTELCRMGTRAVVCQMLDVYAKAGSGRGHGYESPHGAPVVEGRAGRKRVVRVVKPWFIQIDADPAQLSAGSNGKLKHVQLQDFMTADRRVDLREDIERAVARLDGSSEKTPVRDVLRELLNPSDVALCAMRAGASASSVVAEALRMDGDDVRRIFGKLRKEIRRATGYSSVEDGAAPINEEDTMETLEMADLVTDLAIKETVKEIKKKTVKRKRKLTARNHGQEILGGFRIGQEVEYRGESRCGWLKKGCTMVVKGVAKSRGRSYVRLFAVNAKRYTALAAEFIGPKSAKKVSESV